MKPSFNLIEEPWIPCLTSNGQIIETGIRTVFERANELKEIRDNSPLVAPSVTRVLLAILHRNFGPNDPNEWLKLWKAGKFDMKILNGYLNHWKNRFDIFDEKMPFYQTPDLKKDGETPISKMFPEISCGNNSILFSHSFDDATIPLSPAEAARGLVCTQNYAVGGTIAGINSPKESATHATLVRGAAVLLKGDNVFETLLLNLNLYDPYNKKPMPCTDKDIPTWERDSTETWGAERPVEGYLDHLTWQSRTIHLNPYINGNFVQIKSMFYANGVKAANEDLEDTMFSYYTNKDGEKKTIRIRVDREIWRNCHSFMMLEDDKLCPKSFYLVAELIRKGQLSNSKRYKIGVYGMATNKAKIDLWHQSEIPLPAKYLTDKALVDELRRAQEQAEEIAKALQSSIWLLSKEYLSGEKSQFSKDDINKLADSLSPAKTFWSGLQVPLFHLIDELPEAASKSEKTTSWIVDNPIKIANNVFKECSEALPNSAKGIRAKVKAQESFNMHIGSIVKELRKV